MGSGARLRSDNQAFGRAASGTAFLITAIRTPPQPIDDCWALDVGALTNFNQQDWTLTHCDFGEFTFGMWRVNAQVSLTCAIKFCDQIGYQVRGRTGNLTLDWWDVRGKLAFTPDCDSPCVIDSQAGYAGGERGTWDPDNLTWDLSLDLYSVPGPIGYVDGERLDLFITNCWADYIWTITQDPTNPTRAVLEVRNHQLAVGMRVRVQDSIGYDGDWPIIEVPDQNSLILGDVTYTGDSVGWLRPHYDYVPPP